MNRMMRPFESVTSLMTACRDRKERHHAGQRPKLHVFQATQAAPELHWTAGLKVVATASSIHAHRKRLTAVRGFSNGRCRIVPEPTFRRSSNSPRYLAPAMSAPMSSAQMVLSCSTKDSIGRSNPGPQQDVDYR